MRIIPWSREIAEKELAKRLKFARDARVKLEQVWTACERCLYTVAGLEDDRNSASLVGDTTLVPTRGDSRPDISVNSVFRNHRLAHSQLVANPPIVIARPTSSDQSSRRKADAADRFVRFAMRQFKLPDHTSDLALHALTYGTGFMKIIWDPNKGDFLKFDKQTGEVLFSGDISLTNPIPWHIFLDPDCTGWADCRYVFEQMFLPYEEAISRWPEHKELFDTIRRQGSSYNDDRGLERESPVKPIPYDCVEIYQYWEKGLGSNGMLGRFGFCTREGKLIGDIDINPFRFSVEKDEEGNIIPDGELEVAELPYIYFSDIDSPASVWGKSTVAYQIPLQEVHNSVLNVTLDTARAHGVARMIIPDSLTISEDSITTSPTDIVRTSGEGEIDFIPPLAMPQIMGDLLGIVDAGINTMAGVNESMLGQQSRETSGFSMQYATQQGNLIRHRLFTKYTAAVEDMYKKLLNLVIRHWTSERTISVLGKEKAFESVDLSGADINGGFDLIVEYGASLSIDPVSRRQEMLTLMPLFEKAGVSDKFFLRMLKLDELENVYDRADMAAQRQTEIFQEIISTETYVEPREMQDHASMLEYSYDYVMTAEFRDLADHIKGLLEQHIKAREQLAAQGAGGTAPGTPGMMTGQIGGAFGATGVVQAPPTKGPNALPTDAGMTGSQADVTQMTKSAPQG